MTYFSTVRSPSDCGYGHEGRRPVAMRRAILLSLSLIWGCPQTVESLDKDGGVVSDAGTSQDAGADAGPADVGSCVVECSGRVCGLDDACNASCGTCRADEACSEAGECLSACELGGFLCSPDGFGYLACGPNDGLGILDYGSRVGCTGGAECRPATRSCKYDDCVPVDMMVLLDRSSRISHDSTWSWVTESLMERISRHDHEVRFGLRQFPDVNCGPGPIIDLSADAADALAQSLQPPGADASTPLAAALLGLRDKFTRGVDGQAVLLVTAGDESCEDPETAVLEAARLYRMGVRVFVLGVTGQANLTYLDRIAVAGGTGRVYPATTVDEFEDRVAAIFSKVDACANRNAQLGTGWYHACRLASDGLLDCWGRDQDQRLAPPSGKYIQLAAGTDNACAVGEDNKVRCWGRDHRGQSQAPGGNFKQVSGGDSHFCGLKLDGTLDCWGYDDAGQASPPTGQYKQVATGAFHGCAIAEDDTVDCWPNRVPPTGTFSQIAAGGSITCGVRLDRTLACSGGDTPPTGTFSQISQGPYHACAVRSDGTIACWGQNGWMQSTPPPGVFVSVSVNNDYSCAVRADDSVECWGDGGNGQTTPN